jgi:hypothetical protein
MIGGVSLLTAIELICLADLIVCIVILCMADSTTSADIGGVRVSGYFQCVNGAWFLLGIPLSIIGGVGAVFRVEKHIQAYLYYLWGTVVVACVWAYIFITYGSACNTLQPSSGAFKKQAMMVCQSGNGLLIFWMLTTVGILLGCIYLMWSMLQYCKECHATEILSYQEPWMAVSMLADDAAESLAKDRAFIQNKKAQHFDAAEAQAAPGYFHDPYKVDMAHLLANAKPSYKPPYGSMGPRGGMGMQGYGGMDRRGTGMA